MDTIKFGLEAMVKAGYAPALANDDNGKWAVLFDGHAPAAGGPGVYVWDVEEDTRWFDDPAEAVADAVRTIFKEE